MHRRKHIHRAAALLTAVAALALFAVSAQAVNSRPAGMTKAEYRALMLRSEALNRQYARTIGCSGGGDLVRESVTGCAGRESRRAGADRGRQTRRTRPDPARPA